MKKIISYAVMYFLLGFLPPIGALFAEYAEQDKWPTSQRVVAVLIMSLVAGVGAIRGFFDGTVQRHNDERAENDSK